MSFREEIKYYNTQTGQNGSVFTIETNIFKVCTKKYGIERSLLDSITQYKLSINSGETIMFLSNCVIDSNYFTATIQEIQGETLNLNNVYDIEYIPVNYANETNSIVLDAVTVTGILPVSKGGTSLSTLPVNSVIVGNGTNTPTGIKYNLNATVDPEPFIDDSAAGYSIGSRWINILTSKEFVCLDNTVGSAIWNETTAGSSYIGVNGVDVTSNTISADLKLNGGLVIESNKISVDLSATNITGTLATTDGGTGQTSYAVGDILYANTTSTLDKLADVGTGNALISGGVGTAPTYGKIGLTSHVSGTLPVTNGGTGLSNLAVGTGITTSMLIGDGSNPIIPVKINFNGTTAPTVNNDVTEGYTNGSRWLDYINQHEYICTDNSIVGGAIWKPTSITLKTNGGIEYESAELALNLNNTNITGTLSVMDGGTSRSDLGNGFLYGNSTNSIITLKSQMLPIDPSNTDDLTAGYVVGSRWINTTSQKEYICTDATPSNSIWKETTALGGGSYTASNGVQLVGNNFEINAKLNSGITLDVGQLSMDLNATNIEGILGVASGGTGTNTLLAESILIGNDTNAVTQLKCQFNQINDPTVNDDLVQDYAVGSRWINTTNQKEFICTDPGVGSAVWKETTQQDTINIYTASNGVALIGDDFQIDPKTNGGISLEFGQIAVNLGHTNITGTLKVSDGGTGRSDLGLGHLYGDGGNNVITLKGQFTISDPTVNSDSSAGYTTGSRWVNTSTQKEFICLDASVGAAVWKETTQSGGGAYTASNGVQLIGNDFQSDLKTNGGLAIETGKLALNLNHNTITGALTVPNGGTGGASFVQGSILLGDGNNPFVELRTNFSAIVDPTVNDDFSFGYAYGSRWVNSDARKEFVAVEPNIIGGAIWRETTFATGLCDHAEINLTGGSSILGVNPNTDWADMDNLFFSGFNRNFVPTANAWEARYIGTTNMTFAFSLSIAMFCNQADRLFEFGLSFNTNPPFNNILALNNGTSTTQPTVSSSITGRITLIPNSIISIQYRLNDVNLPAPTVMTPVNVYFDIVSLF